MEELEPFQTQLFEAVEGQPDRSHRQCLRHPELESEVFLPATDEREESIGGHEEE